MCFVIHRLCVCSFYEYFIQTCNTVHSFVSGILLIFRHALCVWLYIVSVVSDILFLLFRHAYVFGYTSSLCLTFSLFITACLWLYIVSDILLFKCFTKKMWIDVRCLCLCVVILNMCAGYTLGCLTFFSEYFIQTCNSVWLYIVSVVSDILFFEFCSDTQ